MKNPSIMRLKEKYFFILVAVCSSVAFSCLAQTERPKIGLVLSGGGAKGIAHIGILKAMEEAGLTPDYITGTSMGSIVGGLYAAGYSADELKTVVLDANWSELLTNKIPYNHVTFEEKPFYGRYLADFYFEHKKLILPKGIIEGEALIQLFSRLTRYVHGIGDFNKLPIPFACVATDITTGKPVVLDKGSLALSMRASMAIPSIFTPVRIDGRLLVDGGLVRNMPVNEVLAMGADIVIGVFVSGDLDPEENLTSAVSIMMQSAFITSAFDSREQMAKCNILISPDLQGFSTGSFNMAPQILERGEDTGKKYREIFKKLADSLNRFGPGHVVVKSQEEQQYQFKEVQVEGTSDDRKNFVLGKFRFRPGESISIDELEERIRIIYGTQYFEKLWYEILDSEGSHILKVYATERPQTQIRFAYHYDAENKGGVVGNVTLRNVLLNRSRTIFEADLATFPRVMLDYFKYLGQEQNLALQGTGFFSSNELPAYDNSGELNSVFSSRFTSGRLRFQTTRFLDHAFGVEASFSRLLLKPKIADDSTRFLLSKIKYTYTSLSIFHRFDNFNDRYFPTRGFRSELVLSRTFESDALVTLGDGQEVGSELAPDLIYTKPITSFDVTIFPIVPLSPQFSIFIKVRMKVSDLPAKTLNLGNYDFVGGFIPSLLNATEYPGVSTKEYLLANYFQGRIGVQYKATNNLYLQGVFNYLDSEYPMQWIYSDVDAGTLGDRKRRYSYGVLAGYRSPIGPIAVALAKDHYRSEWKATLIVGFYY
ncbi:MAG TPA: patatin-like phospholipase family protein [Chryseolinea sp.]|nr:patatin-like phospholipase family protein [Chryseolinea sp.]